MSKWTVEQVSDRRSNVLHWLAGGMCGALGGAAVFLSLGSVAHRWFALTSSQTPLALVGGLVGAGAVLVAFAFSTAPTDTVPSFDPALAVNASESMLFVPMTWAPAPLPSRSLSASSKRLALRIHRGRRANAAAKRCAARRLQYRAIPRHTRALVPLMPPTDA